MDSQWIALAFEVLISGGVIAIAVRELILLRRYDRQSDDDGRTG